MSKELINIKMVGTTLNRVCTDTFRAKLEGSVYDLVLKGVFYEAFGTNKGTWTSECEGSLNTEM